MTRDKIQDLLYFENSNLSFSNKGKLDYSIKVILSVIK